jgi:3-hydroxyisobutyrate dehydrogenase-like beta-hydroxyacid dehydrogenase
VAERAGLDLEATLQALTAGAGTSRMLEIRGPLMLSGDYGDPTMRVLTFQKDLDIITGFLREVGCPALLFTAAAQLNLAALAQGHANEDTASVFAVLQLLAGAAEPSSAGAPASAHYYE